MTSNSAFRRTFYCLAISTLLAFLVERAAAAPVIGPLRADDVVIANQLLNETLKTQSSGNIAAGLSDGAVVEASSMVIELMNAARAKVLAASGNECLGTIARCDVAS
jgi:hypothetical protein